MDGEMKEDIKTLWNWDHLNDRDYTPASPKAEYLYWINVRERDDD